MYLCELLAIALPFSAVRTSKLLSFHRLPEWTEVSRLFQALDRRLAPVCQAQMPARETGQDQSNDARYHTEQDVVDRHQALVVLIIAQNLAPKPSGGDTETKPRVKRRVDEEK